MKKQHLSGAAILAALGALGGFGGHPQAEMKLPKPRVYGRILYYSQLGPAVRNDNTKTNDKHPYIPMSTVLDHKRKEGMRPSRVLRQKKAKPAQYKEQARLCDYRTDLHFAIGYEVRKLNVRRPKVKPARIKRLVRLNRCLVKVGG